MALRLGSGITGQRAEILSQRGLVPVFPFLAIISLSVLSNLIILTGPLFMLQVYDRVLTSRSIPTLAALTILVTCLYAFYATIETLRARMGTRISELFERALGSRLMEAAVYSRSTGTGAVAFDPTREGDTFRQFIGGTGPMALLDLPWSPLYLTIVFLLHPLLGWFAIGGAVVIIVLLLCNEIYARTPSQDANLAATVRQRESDGIKQNSESVIAMGMLPDLQELWRASTMKLLRAQRVASDRAAIFTNTIKGSRFFLQSGVLALGAYLVIQNEITGGLMIAASVVTSRALAPVEQIVGQWRYFVAARQSYGRIRQAIIDLPLTSQTTLLSQPKSSLLVRRLATAPRKGQAPSLALVNFSLEAGDALGVLGPSGSGKSSLARALVGVWPVLSGDIRLDGSLLTHYHRDQVGQIIGYLPQSVELFSGTVAQNIARFQRNASTEQIIQAAKEASVLDLINSLPNGFDTQVGDRGDRLSAGQRQQIGLARALFGRPFLVVLDEPNSNLDAEGEAALSDAIQIIRGRGGIAVVIAHRPSAIAAVNKLLFIKAGRQFAFGPKNDVLQQITLPANSDKVRVIKAPVL